MKLNPPAFLVVATTSIVIGLILLMFFVPVPDSIQNLLSGLIGVIVAKWQTVVDYHFGSSSGSKAKSDLLSEIAGTGDGTITSKTTTKIDRTTTAVVDPPPDKI